jgi:hypothetical protein
MDDMGTKIDILEQSITSLMDRAGLDHDGASVLSERQYIDENNNNNNNNNNSTSSLDVGERQLPTSILNNDDNDS